MLTLAKRALDAASLRLLKSGVSKADTRRFGPILCPSALPPDNVMLQWAKIYIGAAEPRIGRSGAVCPFVPATLAAETFLFAFHDEVADLHAMRGALLARTIEYKTRWPDTVRKNHMVSVLLVFPCVSAENGHWVDQVHTELKSYLMDKGIMLSQFHPRCEKGAIRNPEFKAYTSPMPCIVVRHMGIHDIIFLDHNEKGFTEYHRRFAEDYAKGEVGNVHGYEDRFNAACQRFNIQRNLV